MTSYIVETYFFNSSMEVVCSLLMSKEVLSVSGETSRERRMIGSVSAGLPTKDIGGLASPVISLEGIRRANGAECSL